MEIVNLLAACFDQDVNKIKICTNKMTFLKDLGKNFQSPLYDLYHKNVDAQSEIYQKVNN